MLSNLINRHPDILSFSEFFIFLADIGVNVSEVFPSEPLDGKQFWELIAGFKPIMNTLLYKGIKKPEVLYPYKLATSKFNAKAGVPAILQTTLPHITNNHDQLFHKLKPFIQKQHRTTVRWHYDNLFSWLKERFHKKVWVERSGGSFLFTKELVDLYPEARFIHIFRDGRDTALSMASHYGFRMASIAMTFKHFLGFDPF